MQRGSSNGWPSDVLGVGLDGPMGPDHDEEREAWLALSTAAGVGPPGFEALLAAFGSATAVLRVASSPGGPRRIAVALESVADARARTREERDIGSAIAVAARGASRLAAAVRSLGLAIVTTDDEAYPERLRRIDLPPPVLLVRGRVGSLSTERAVAIVGTRRATEAGRSTAARIGGALVAADTTVVSGLAIGIDGAAHAAVVAAGGTTVAVIGAGHARLYPRAHDRLASAIVEAGGAVVSELAPETEPQTWTFPRRNRLISGLSDAVVVVEAPVRSGALTTASWALQQGRGCFVVPGRLDDRHAAGGNALLHEAPTEARIVVGIPELLADLGLVRDAAGSAPALVAPTLTELGGTAARIAGRLVEGDATVDALVSATGLPVATVLAALTLLERQGLATAALGRYRPAGTLAIEPRPRRRAAPRHRRSEPRPSAA